MLFTLFKIKFKTFILRLKIIRLLSQRSVLLRRKCDSLFKDDRRAMLCDEFFDTVEKSHLKPPKCDVAWTTSVFVACTIALKPKLLSLLIAFFW